MLLSEIKSIQNGRIITEDGGVGSGVKGHKTFRNKLNIKRFISKIINQQDMGKKTEIWQRANLTKEEINQIIPEMILHLPAGYYKLHDRKLGTNLIDKMYEQYGWMPSMMVSESTMLGLQALYPERIYASFTLGLDAIEIKKKLFSKDEDNPASLMAFQGIKISIENPKGSIRKGEDEDGEKWKTKMYYPYGFIKNTEGVDGDEIDCFIGPNPNAESVYIIRLKDDDHEDKVMLGFPSREHARDAFCVHYDQPQDHLGPITEMTMENFKSAIARHKKGTRIG